MAEYGTLIDPQRPIPQVITEITGLTEDDLKGAPTEAEVASDIRDFIGLGTPVAHNLAFDMRFLNAMFRRNKLVEVAAVGIDTLAISRSLFPKLCVYPEGGGSHRLSNLMYHFRLEDSYANSHRARDDVMLLVEVFRHLQDYAAGGVGKVSGGCHTWLSYLRIAHGSDSRWRQKSSYLQKAALLYG